MGKEGKKARERESRKHELVTTIVEMMLVPWVRVVGPEVGRSWSLWSGVEVDPRGPADGRDVGHERGDQMIIKCFA